MNKEIIAVKNFWKEDWYQDLVNKIRNIQLEASWELVKIKWAIGDEICVSVLDHKDRAKFGERIMERLSIDTGISVTELNLCRQFRRKFSDLTAAAVKLKGLSWYKIRTKYLPEHKKAMRRDEWLRIYDIWNFASRDEHFGIEYPGNIPAGIVLNVLYYYTEENDLVVDPMAGGGVTIDCCKYLNRRCLAYDINPARDDIKLNDITKGYPDETKGCDLIFLDPPYWKKKEEDYGENSISALSRKEFLTFFGFIAEESLRILKKDGYLALLMEPYVDYGDSKNSLWVYEYIMEFLMKDWKVERIFDVPETTQRYQAHDVERAKKDKQILTLRRQLIIFRR